MQRTFFIYILLIALFTCLFCSSPPDNETKRHQFNLPEIVRYLKLAATYAVQSRIKNHDMDIDAAVNNIKWNWGEGVLMFGLIRAHQIVKDSLIAEFVSRWIDSHIKKGVRFRKTDHITPSAVIAEMLIRGMLPEQKHEYFQILEQSYNFLTQIDDSELEIPVNHDDRTFVKLSWRGRTWLDDLFMTVPFMTRYDQLHNDVDLTGKIAGHFYAHQRLLQHIPTDSGTCLLRHGKRLFKDYPFDFWLPQSNIAWARGHGWYIAALADFLAHLPADNPHFQILFPHFKKLLDQILPCQLKNGLFPTILNDSASYGEVSATALIVYAAVIGVKNNWLSRDPYYRHIKKAILGILSYISETGRISGVSAGTGAYPFLFYYKSRPRGSYPWGDGAVLLALSETVDLIMSDMFSYNLLRKCK